MKMELAQALVDLLQQDDDTIAIRKDYSGRGMYGKTTTAIVTTLKVVEVLGIVIACADELVDVDFDPRFMNIKPLQTDSMGLGIVIY